MSGFHRFMPMALLVFSLVSACGRQTVTESLLSADQSLAFTIEVEARRESDTEKFAAVLLKTDQPNLALQTNITRYAGRKLDGLDASVAAETLLSAYAEEVAFTTSSKDGPNCWHTSIASLFARWEKARYMHDTEFSCHVRTWFREVKDPKFGDLIRFLDASGEEVHGATFIGIDRGTQEAVVFTKNGYSKIEGWGFMTFADLKEVYGSAESVKFYTPIQAAEEPSQPGAKCYQQFLESKGYQKRMDQKAFEGTMDVPFPKPAIY